VLKLSGADAAILVAGQPFNAAHAHAECMMTGTAGTACSFIVPVIVERSLRDLIVY
jgi:hypothetical protein